MGGNCSSIYCDTAFACSNEQLVDNSSYFYAHGYKSLYGSGTSVIGDCPYAFFGEISPTPGANLYCHGGVSCNSMDYVDITGSMECSGDSSCSNILNSTLGKSASCVASNSCSMSTINTNSARCFADLSCSHSDIDNSGELWGYGAFSLIKEIQVDK